MVYCVTKAEFFFGFEVDEDLYSYEDLEILLKNHPDFELVLAMMGDEISQTFITLKKAYYCSDDMELVEISTTFGSQYYDGPVFFRKLFNFINDHLPSIIYQKDMIGWKLISSAWSST